ncbi:hypothetical protein Bca101_069820 [Brassica carinata]
MKPYLIGNNSFQYHYHFEKENNSCTEYGKIPRYAFPSRSWPYHSVPDGQRVPRRDIDAAYRSAPQLNLRHALEQEEEGSAEQESVCRMRLVYDQSSEDDHPGSFFRQTSPMPNLYISGRTPPNPRT